MAINFPDSPVNGDTHVVGNVTYVYNNAKAKWNGAGQTLNDRLTEGSNSLEITASNELQWTGGNVGIGTNPTRPFHLHNTSTASLLVSGTVPQIRFNSDPADGIDNERAIIGLATGTSTFMSNAVEGDLVIRSEDGKSILFGEGTNEKVRIGPSGAGQIGIGTTPTTNAALDINQGYYSIMYGSVNGANGGRPDNTNKEGRIVQYHRDNEEEPLGAIVTFSQSNAGKVYIGGGSSLVNAATETALYAASNYTTTGGTKMLSVTTSGVTANELFTVTHPDASSADTALFQNTTSGGDNRVRINVFANGGGDPYLKFDAGGSNFVVGEQYNGTTNNQLLMGVGETPATVAGFGVDGNGKTWSGTHLDGNGQFSIRNNASSRYTTFELTGNSLDNYKMIRAAGKWLTRGDSERNFDLVSSVDNGTNNNIMIEFKFYLNSATTSLAGIVTGRAGYFRSGGNYTFWTNTPTVSMYSGSGYGAGSISWVGGGTNVKTLRYTTDSNTNYTNYIVKELVVTGYDFANAAIL